MIVFAVNSIRKKLWIAAAVALIALLITAAVHFFPGSSIVSSDVEEKHYPGEPVRVSGDFDEYWQQRLSVLED